ncbi:putative ubiquitin-like activating enzyme [Hortaea werneckii]|nr:putative ubiquitin-like activating enzyme [Hortaea werneckii]KAI7061036.1 putative ubiquitin-like activating enzyme [Hortaea werneckii]KAI7294892.1 putative ubiquitin-like activating enzyme [Hortaea werneckii]KAI7383729.1 putative ubiquitin-like activating enzyme [Hortaea werneckii]KAI7475063.1 putative ubiquitin-like activating enzyme [Hortaea werneckii]
MQRRDRGVAQSLGLPLTKRVKESRVLLVGAGGIGCEVLKNLVCCGFGSLPLAAQKPPPTDTETEAKVQQEKKPEIVVVDLDTIDLSNLNRQFLFRKQHIKKPKAVVAKETASAFNPSVNIDAHHASIFDSQYNVEFFESFDLVFNALDNLAARRHVNKMCLAADVPLIESGTTGFNGQVQTIKKGVTECYDCNPKPVQKSFPICTIRSTPSQPIHCIVWAKSYLFPEMFGTSEEDSADVAVTEGDNVEEVAKLKEEAEALKKVRDLMGKSEFAQEVFNKVFHDDIERLRSMSEMWQSRKAPESLDFATLVKEIDADIVKRGQALAVQDQSPWSLHDNLAVFCYSLDALSSRAQAGEKVIEFDKDDKDTLDFVASAANLRSYIFGIPLHSEWDIKQMAGNIIPAIATSNALTASLCVMEAFKIIRSQPAQQQGLAKPTTNNHLPTETQSSLAPPPTSSSAPASSSSSGGGAKPSEPISALGGSKMVFLNSRSTERMITTQHLMPPNPTCPVCSPVYAKLLVPADTKATLHELVLLLKEKTGFEDFSLTTSAGVIYDPDLEDNLSKPLGEYVNEATGNEFLTVSDERSGEEGGKVDILLSSVVVRDSSQLVGEGKLGLWPEELHLPPKPKKAGPGAEEEETRVDGVVVDGDGKVDLEATNSSSGAAAAAAAQKRKREAEEEVEEAQKQKKMKGDGDVLVVQDDEAILID